MLLLPCFLTWLTGHWWGSRFGATWRNRLEPGWANRLFISPWFLRCGLILAGINAAVIFHLIASDIEPTTLGIIFVCLLAGLASGVALGRESY